MQTVSVKEGEGDDLLSSYTGDMDPSLRRKRYMAISKKIWVQCNSYYNEHFSARQNLLL